MHRHQQPPAYNPGYNQHGPAANQFQHQSQQQQQYYNDNRPIQHQQYHQPQGMTPQHQQQQQQQQQHQKQHQHRQKQQKAKGQSRGGQGARQGGRVKENSEISLIVKYLLFFVNLLCWIVGLLIIGIGVWGWHDRGALDGVKTLDSIIQSPIVDPSWWLVILGAIIFLIATPGWLGALRENTFLLNMYKVLMIVVLLLEIGAAVAIYFYADEIEQQFEDTLLNSAIPEYRENPDFQDLIDTVQTELKCCGVTGYNDWELNFYFDCSSTDAAGQRSNPEACGVPFSCCRQETDSVVVNTQCGYNARSPTKNSTGEIYTAGCVGNFKYWLVQRFDLIVVAITGGVILVVEFLGCGLAQTLVNDIERQKSKW